MMTDTQDKIDEVLDNLSSAEATFNSRNWDIKDKRKAEREWKSNRDEAKAAIEKLILEARIDELDIVLPKTLDYDITPTQANKVSMRIESLESELKAKLGDK